MAVQPIPAGYHAVTPYLIVADAKAALEFYTRALGAIEEMRMVDPESGRIGHAEIKIGDSHVMLADEHPERFRGPKFYGGTPVSLMVYVPDVDARFRRMLAAGSIELRPLANQFYGDRSGTLQDPFGHVWTIATHVEDVPPEEMEARAKAEREG